MLIISIIYNLQYIDGDKNVYGFKGIFIDFNYTVYGLNIWIYRYWLDIHMCVCAYKSIYVYIGDLIYS